MRLLNQDTKVAALARAPLFEGRSKKELTELARSTDDLEVGAGKVACREGEPGREFFVIVEAEAEVGKGGLKVGMMGPGDFFGEIALVDRSGRTATVTATAPLRFCALTSRSFSGLLDHNLQVERKVLGALAKRVLSS